MVSKLWTPKLSNIVEAKTLHLTFSKDEAIKTCEEYNATLPYSKYVALI